MIDELEDGKDELDGVGLGEEEDDSLLLSALLEEELKEENDDAPPLPQLVAINEIARMDVNNLILFIVYLLAINDTEKKKKYKEDTSYFVFLIEIRFFK